MNFSMLCVCLGVGEMLIVSGLLCSAISLSSLSKICGSNKMVKSARPSNEQSASTNTYENER